MISFFKKVCGLFTLSDNGLQILASFLHVPLGFPAIADLWRVHTDESDLLFLSPDIDPKSITVNDLQNRCLFDGLGVSERGEEEQEEEKRQQDFQLAPAHGRDSTRMGGDVKME